MKLTTTIRNRGNSFLFRSCNSLVLPLSCLRNYRYFTVYKDTHRCGVVWGPKEQLSQTVSVRLLKAHLLLLLQKLGGLSPLRPPFRPP